MPYAEGRLVYDADSHVHEPPGWLDDLLEPSIADRAQEVLGRPERGKIEHVLEKFTSHQQDAEFRQRDAEEILLRKGFEAPGAFIKEDRPAALDLLGFASQLVFTSTALRLLAAVDHGGDAELAYGFARAQNRWMVNFCSVDARLLPVCYVPFIDIEQAAAFTTETLEAGAAALMIGSACPKHHSPSHIGFDRVWAQAEEAGIPVVFHVGGGTRMDLTYKENGMPAVKDFIGGDGNFTSVSFMAIPTAPMQTLAAMIIDGVLERFPRLKLGVIEQGAAWVPVWMWSMDAAADAFQKNEERLSRLSLKPSEYVQRQIRFTPYPHEPAGRIIEQTGPDVCMFSSDYPHPEGGRNPLKRFDDSLTGRSDDEKHRFYADNFVDLMGNALAPVLAPV
jgi:predicted TIM-barrel fold metal-dependent hydrolase